MTFNPISMTLHTGVHVFAYLVCKRSKESREQKVTQVKSNLLRLSFPTRTRSMTSLSCHNPALESAVDAYASRLLRLQSAQEAIIDPSVGPYVTSVIRSSLGSDDALSPVSEFSIESMIEYESLM